MCRPYLTFHPPFDINPNKIIAISLIRSHFSLSLWKDDNLSISLNEERRACPLTTDSSFGHHQYKPGIICTWRWLFQVDHPLKLVGKIYWTCRCMSWMFNSILPHWPKLNTYKLEIYLFSFWGALQNFEVITGLNYRFTGNLHVHFFSTYETRIMTTQKDLTMCCIGTGKCYKKELRILFIWRMLILIFQPNFMFFWIFSYLLVSVNIHAMKITIWNLADVWLIIFSSDPPNIILCERTGIGYKIIVKSKFCAQPMHQIYVIKYCILLKTNLSE